VGPPEGEEFSIGKKFENRRWKVENGKWDEENVK
jgi:hypothetical protein